MYLLFLLNFGKLFQAPIDYGTTRAKPFADKEEIMTGFQRVFLQNYAREVKYFFKGNALGGWRFQ